MSTDGARVVYRHGRERDFTEEEYYALSDEIRAAKERGDMETYDRLFDILPVNPDVVMAFKKVYGKEYVLNMNLDLTEANLRFGEGWLDAPNEW